MKKYSTPTIRLSQHKSLDILTASSGGSINPMPWNAANREDEIRQSRDWSEFESK